MGSVDYKEKRPQHPHLLFRHVMTQQEGPGRGQQNWELHKPLFLIRCPDLGVLCGNAEWTKRGVAEEF